MADCKCGKNNQHSIREGGKCDAMIAGKLKEWEILQAARKARKARKR